MSDKKKPGPERSKRRKKAEAAGMSENEMYTALDLAKIPKEKFEELIDSDDPPTITELRRIGRGESRKSRKPKKRKKQVKVTCPCCDNEFTIEK